MPDPRTEKCVLRAKMRAARRALPPEEYTARSQAVAERLVALPEWRLAPAVLAYAASKDNEVDTRPIVEALLAEGRSVYTPIAATDGMMQWSRLAAWGELEPARFGILEPKPNCRRIEPVPEGSLALVPGLAFTRNGYRIGFGGGYYDVFLSHFDGFSVGLAFDMQLLDSLPITEHDQPVDAVVTETAVYYQCKDKG